jgi:hypothetical protein
MNKEEKNSHVLPLRYWMVHFFPWLQVTLQGIREKYNKFRVIFNSSKQTSPDKAVLNLMTTTDHKAIIDFGQAKMNLFINIYNWRVSYPDKTIYLALADITACFRFPRISTNVTGAFGFMAEGYYFLSTSHVFGSNTSASSWEPLRQAIQSMIPIYSQQDGLVAKHKTLLDTLKWELSASDNVRPVRAFKCELNKGILDDDPLTANIYVDNILAAAAFKERMIRLLVAVIEAIFLVCGIPDMFVC